MAREAAAGVAWQGDSWMAAAIADRVTVSARARSGLSKERASENLNSSSLASDESDHPDHLLRGAGMLLRPRPRAAGQGIMTVPVMVISSCLIRALAGGAAALVGLKCHGQSHGDDHLQSQCKPGHSNIVYKTVQYITLLA